MSGHAYNLSYNTHPVLIDNVGIHMFPLLFIVVVERGDQPHTECKIEYGIG